MKSVGESMAIGRTFKESLLKACRSLETGRDGLASLITKIDYVKFADMLRNVGDDGSVTASPPRRDDTVPIPDDRTLKTALLEIIKTPLGERLFYIGDALRVGATADEVCKATAIDPWFIAQLVELLDVERKLKALGKASHIPGEQPSALTGGKLEAAELRPREDARLLRHVDRGIPEQHAGCDSRPAQRAGRDADLRTRRQLRRRVQSADAVHVLDLGRPQRSRADQEQEGHDPGRGPNRIGQGIEFDYCCVPCVVRAA